MAKVLIAWGKLQKNFPVREIKGNLHILLRHRDFGVANVVNYLVLRIKFITFFAAKNFYFVLRNCVYVQGKQEI